MASGADETPPRIGILSTREAGEFALLLTAVLSGEDAVALVERDNLRAIEEEMRANAGALPASAIEGADALVWIEKLPLGNTPLLDVRMVETRTGLTLTRGPVPGAALSEEAVARASGRIVEQAARLGAAPDGDAALLSLLGLRFEVAQVDGEVLGESVNRLVAANLGREPGVRVLERWQTRELSWEKSLGADAGANEGLLAGSAVVDGSLGIRDGRITARVRLRRGLNGKGETATATGSLEDLPGFCEAVAAAISRMATGGSKPVPWRREDESAGYLALAGWAIANGLADDAISAAETSAALTPRLPEALAMRIRAYFFRAWPEDMTTRNFPVYRPATGREFDAVASLGDARHALGLARDFAASVPHREAEASQAGVVGVEADPNDSLWLAHRAFFPSCCAIIRSYELGDAAGAGEAIGEIRAGLRTLSESIFASGDRELALEHSVEALAWLGAWSETPEAAAETAGRLLARPMATRYWHLPLLRSVWASVLREPFAIREAGDGGTPGPQRNGAPLSLKTDPDAVDRARRAWSTLAEKLSASGDLVTRLDGLMLGFFLSQDDAGRHERLGAIFRELRDNREKFDSGDDPLAFWHLEFAFEAVEKGGAPEEFRDFPAMFLEYLLKNRGAIPTRDLFLFAERRWRPEDRRRLEPALQAYRNRLAAGNRTEPDAYRKVIDQIAAKLAAAIPAGAPPPTPMSGTPPPGRGGGGTLPDVGGVLIVSRLRNPQLEVGGGRAASKSHPRTAFAVDGGLWTLMARGLYRMDLEQPGVSVAVEFPGKADPNYSTVVAFDRWLVVTGADGVWRSGLSNGAGGWERLPLPEYSTYRTMVAGGALFALFGDERGPAGGGRGVLSLDPETGAFEIVASNLRNPPANTLDTRLVAGAPAGIFALGDRRFVALHVREEVVPKAEILESGGRDRDWKAIQSVEFQRLVALRGGAGDALLGIGSASYGSNEVSEIVSFDPGGGPVALASESGSAGFSKSDGKMARWTYPKSLQIVPGDRRRIFSVVFSEETLYVLTALPPRRRPEQTVEEHTLHVFRPGGQVNSIPLAFQPNPEVLSKIGGAPDFVRDGAEHPEIQSDSLLVVPGKAIVIATDVGFWVIPFADLSSRLSP
ncbi:MAG: hypothetical protein KDM91_02195 [Verrucomicrobiae bacterium]|nr:hypothetical protein [Verrucomicrobiae bacterium]